VGFEREPHRHPFLVRRLGDDPDFLRRVEAAERLGQPRSRLEGREPEEVTEHEYDGDVLVRSTTVREPLWTEQDFAEQLALAEYRDSLCDCCGLPKSMTLADERDAPRFVVSKRYCLARRTLIESQQAFTNNGKDAKPAHDALRWTIRAEKR
jgi:hypothetical protein